MPAINFFVGQIMIIRFGLVACLLTITGCAAERAIVASDAKSKMVGLSKEQVLACMGIPASKAMEGGTEVWGYNSGGATQSVGVTTASGSATAMGTGRMVTASGSSTGIGFGSTQELYCVVSVVMVGGKVSQVNYSGPTGAGLLTGGEQCAYAVRNCAR